MCDIPVRSFKFA